MKDKEKIVYLVRHGESEGNVIARSLGGYVAALDYSKESPLTEKGKNQAEKTGEFLVSLGIDFDLVLSSDYLRAKQTAEIINHEIRTKIIFSNLCVESDRIPDLQTEEFLESELRPTIDDLAKRVTEFISYLDNLEEKRIVVVTHSMFMRALLIYLIHGEIVYENLNFLHYFIRGLSLHNTGICVMSENVKNGWKMVTWNSIGHLKDIK